MTKFHLQELVFISSVLRFEQFLPGEQKNLNKIENVLINPSKACKKFDSKMAKIYENFTWKNDSN